VGSNPTLSAQTKSKLNMFFVYLLYSERLNKRYVGSSKDIENRLSEHNKGKSNFTKTGIPWKLIYNESYLTFSEARKREVFLKSGVGRKFLDQILEK
jgi:putative endonuclease